VSLEGEGQIEYKKRDVAVQQLERAALLLLYGGFEVATHTLLGAVQQLLEDHASVSSNDLVLGFKAARIRLATANGIETKEILNTERIARNFFKHADRGVDKDPEATLVGVDLDSVNALLFVMCFLGLSVSSGGVLSVLLPAFVFCLDQCEKGIEDYGIIVSNADYYSDLRAKFIQAPVELRKEAMLQEYHRLKAQFK
jgi:hypothetical protein